MIKRETHDSVANMKSDVAHASDDVGDAVRTDLDI